LAVFVLLVVGCTPSAVIRPDDATFARATDRLRQSARHLDTEAALEAPRRDEPTPDEALFLQAESFYRYRFEMRPPTAGSFAAQAAAAFVEFSPLSVLAASEGINDVRLQTYNAAAQLYETLLLRYPDSKLRPLALWRLGWTYRNVSLSGFPRDADHALAELKDTPFAGVAEEARRVPYKSQDAALAWSILPGAGQMYVGRWGNGMLRLGIATGFAAAAIVPIVLQVKDAEFDWRSTLVSVLGFVGLQVTYTSSYQDAQRSALEFNERQEAAFEASHPQAP
jgi:hypothetical protein